jgi:hypothetical protein
MLSGYFPFWGASLLIYFAGAEPLLFVPQIELREHIPAGLRVQEYPWGDLKCSDPYSVLVSAVGDKLVRAKIEPEQTGINHSAARTSLPFKPPSRSPFLKALPGSCLRSPPSRTVNAGRVLRNSI